MRSPSFAPGIGMDQQLDFDEVPTSVTFREALVNERPATKRPDWIARSLYALMVGGALFYVLLVAWFVAWLLGGG